MQPHRSARRLLRCCVAILALCAGTSFAQSAYVTVLEGDAVSRSPDNSQFRVAPGMPVANGQTVTAFPGARMEIRAGATLLRLDGDSEATFTWIDARAVRVSLAYGVLQARLLSPVNVQRVEIGMPAGYLVPLEPGRFRVDFPRGSAVASVSAVGGAAQLTGPAGAATLPANARFEISLAPPRGYRAVPPYTDAFDDWSLALDQRYDEAYAQRAPEPYYAEPPPVAYGGPAWIPPPIYAAPIYGGPIYRPYRYYPYPHPRPPVIVPPPVRPPVVLPPRVPGFPPPHVRPPVAGVPPHPAPPALAPPQRPPAMPPPQRPPIAVAPPPPVPRPGLPQAAPPRGMFGNPIGAAPPVGRGPPPSPGGRDGRGWGPR
jgi:hypothetical protein